MDDLITRLRTLMAEVEARIQQGEVLGDDDVSPKLKEALRLPSVGEAVREQPKPRSEPPMTSKTYGSNSQEHTSMSRPRDIKLDDYIPASSHVYPPDDFIGCGDRDPLGHDELIRR